jgi:HAD superfamily hydrolase (TIGR01549 family)
MIKAVIFDIDGTLVDSVDLHAECWREALAQFGVDVPFARIRAEIGKGGDQLLPVFLSPAQLADMGEAVDRYRGALFKREYLPNVRAFPKVRELFDRLRQDGIRIALASSSKADELAHYKRLARIDGLVEVEISADDAERSKPCPDIFQAALDRLAPLTAAEVLAVGDTPYDAKAAGKVGIRTVGVLCGGFSERGLRLAGCAAIYRDPADLLASKTIPIRRAD